MILRARGLTHQWGAGPAGRTASALGRCTCCSSSRSPGPAAPQGGLQPPGASHSRGSSSPVGTETCVTDGLGKPSSQTGGQSRQRSANPKVQNEGKEVARMGTSISSMKVKAWRDLKRFSIELPHQSDLGNMLKCSFLGLHRGIDAVGLGWGPGSYTLLALQVLNVSI